MNISAEQANLLRQWFDSLQDVHPKYLERKDYELATQIYEICGMPIPESIKNNTPVGTMDAKPNGKVV